LQGKVPKEIHAIVTETLAYFLPGRAKDLSAPLNSSGIDIAELTFPERLGNYLILALTPTIFSPIITP